MIEQRVINSCLLNSEHLDLLMQYDRNIFQKNEHRIIFDVLESLYQDDIAVDLPVLIARCNEMKARININEFVAKIAGFGTSPGIDYLLMQLYTEKHKAEIRDTAIDLYKAIENRSINYDEFVNKIIELSETKAPAVDDYSMSALAQKPLDEVFSKQRYVKSGFPSLDKKLVGFFNGQMIIIAGRPGLGKTSLAIQIAFRFDSLYFISEMLRPELYARILSTQCEVESVRIMTKDLKENEMIKIIEQHASNKDLKIKIVDSFNDIKDFERIVRQFMKKPKKPQIIFFDYIQRFSGGRGSAKHEKVSDISNRLKDMAMKYNIPVIVLSQLSREIEKVKRSPVLSDLRDSGTLEQDADSVIFLHNDNIIIAKNRLGKTGKINTNDRIKIRFIPKYYKFEDCAYIDELKKYDLEGNNE